MDGTSVAAEVAKRFGEEGERAQRQLERIAEVMKPSWLAEIAERAEQAIHENDPVCKRADATPRTRGGVLFAVARRTAFELVKSGALARRTFYQCFCWREPRPKELAVPVAKPKPQPKVKRKVSPSPPWLPARGRAAAPEAEVYTVRRLHRQGSRQ